MSKIRIGVVGCGWAGRQAAHAAFVGSRTSLIAVADMDAERRQKVAHEFQIPHVHGDYRELLANPSVDAVYLATNPDVRLPMVLDALAAGKHVLVQKPHAVRAPEILEMEAAAHRTGNTLQFCYFLRHSPKNRQIRRAILSGKIGDPYHARIFLKFNYLPPLNDGTRWLHVYGQKGGALGQHASHELNLVWWWMGSPRPDWAFAVKHSVYPAYHGPEGPAEDYFSGLVGLEGDKTIQIDCSRWLHCDTPTVVEVYGRDGAVSGGAIQRFRDGKFQREEVNEPIEIAHGEPPKDQPCYFFYEVEHFAMAIAGEVDPDMAAPEAYQFMKLLDALYDSAKTGEKVSIV